MAVDDPDMIDFVARGKDGDCLLVVSDHLEWDHDGEHLLVLQEKINRYLNFIASGELYDKFPDTQGNPIAIRIYFEHLPDAEALEFFELAKGAVENVGFKLEWQQLPE